MLFFLACGTLIVVALLLRSDGTSEAAATANEPAVIEAVAGTDLSRVRLTEAAAKRIGLRTVAVRSTSSAGSAVRRVVPYSALLYDDDGRTWVYTSPKKLTFLRAAVEVTRVEGQLAFLSRGPAAGTKVVTVGATELLGSEFEVGH